MRGRYGNAQHRHDQKAQRAGEVGRKTLVFFEFHHVHAYGLDDLLAAHARAQAHGCAAKHHKPYGDYGSGNIGLARGKCHAQEEHADKLLTVLRAMHKTHCCGAKDLCVLKERVGTPTVEACANNGNHFCGCPANRKAKEQAHHQAIDDLDPFVHIDAAGASQGNGGSGETGDEAMAFAGGDAEDRGAHAIDHNGEERCAQRYKRHGRISAKVDHIADGRGYARVDMGHDKNAKEVADGAHDNGRPHAHAPRGDAGGDGIRGIGPAVDEDDAQRKGDGDCQKQDSRLPVGEKTQERFPRRPP